LDARNSDLKGEEDGEVDDHDDPASEEDGVSLKISTLHTAEEAANATGEAGEAADEEAIDEEFVEEVDERGDRVLSHFDETGVEFVELELVPENLH
jgi:hypothetical protein